LLGKVQGRKSFQWFIKVACVVDQLDGCEAARENVERCWTRVAKK
jgi:hypothetical protein